jgi:hypothetical protein
MSRSARPIGFGLVLLGLCFFCNPYFAVIDFLPDFIGCLLIFWGLGRVSQIQGSMREARSAFLKVAIVDILKSVTLLIVFGAGSPNEQATALLLVGFSAAVLELMFLIPAILHLFDGFSDFATSFDCVSLYGNNKGGLSLTDRIKKATIIFLIIRESVCLLPEFTALTKSSYQDSMWNHIYEHIGVMRGFACLIVAAAGIYWLIFLICYFHKLRSEKEVLMRAGAAYQAYYDAHPGIAVERRHRISFALLFVGSLLLVDFYLDFRNILPDGIAGILLLAAALIPSVDKKHRIIAAIAAGVYTVVSTLSSKCSYDFANNYSIGEITKNTEASRAYLQMWLMALAEFLVFLAMLVCILLLLRAVIKKWAGYRPEYKRSDFEDRCQSGLLAELDGKLIRCFVFGFISGLLSFLFDYIKELPGKGILRLLDYIWILDFCAGILFAAVLASLLSNVYSEIKNRFLYD